MNSQCSPTSLKRSTESRNDLKPFTDSNTGRAFGLKYSKIDKIRSEVIALHVLRTSTCTAQTPLTELVLS
ncbi:hypothetical protein FOBRF1_010380 [Fusarium oxysporum]